MLYSAATTIWSNASPYPRAVDCQRLSQPTKSIGRRYVVRYLKWTVRSLLLSALVLIGVVAGPPPVYGAQVTQLSLDSRVEPPGMDTGVDLTTGVPVVITATGLTYYGYQGGTECVGWPQIDPDGNRSLDGVPCSKTYNSLAVRPDLPIGTLIGRIGSGDWFAIGSSKSFTPTTSGRLFLLYNECYWVDDSGSYSVNISVGPLDAFRSPVDSTPNWRNDYGGHTPLANIQPCYNKPYNQLWHAGQDYGFHASVIAGRSGQNPNDWTNNTPVRAVADGVVLYSSKDPGTTKSYPGGVVIIEHKMPDGSKVYSMNGHLDPTKIVVSSKNATRNVTKGQVIASGLIEQVWIDQKTKKVTLDNTHLHWEIRYFYDASQIKQAPNYTSGCAGIPGPGYTYPGTPDNFSAIVGKNKDGTFIYKTYQWTNPEQFVANN